MPFLCSYLEVMNLFPPFLRVPVIAALAALIGVCGTPLGAQTPDQGEKELRGLSPSRPNEEPPEGLPTPDDVVREALRRPPTDPEKRAEVLKALYARLATETRADMAKSISKAIERVWDSSGSPTHDLLLQRASKAIKEKKYDLAFPLLDTIVELQPDFAEAFSVRAYAFFAKNEPHRALADLRRVLALDPKHYRALEGVGQILRDLGEKKAALEAYRKLIEVYPLFDGAQKAVEQLTIEVEGQRI